MIQSIINNYTRWLNGEPNNININSGSNKQHCTDVVSNDHIYGYYWNDIDCTNSSFHLFVCNFNPNISM